MNGTSTVREGNRYSLTLAPPHQGSNIISVDCGNPVCGIRSDRPQLISVPKTTEKPAASSTSGPGARIANEPRRVRSTINDDVDDAPILDVPQDSDESIDEENSPLEATAMVGDAAENKKATVDTRIVGGKEAPPQQWPFIAALLRDGKFICGCSILSSRWILTAAHCLSEYDTKKYNFQV